MKILSFMSHRIIRECTKTTMMKKDIRIILIYKLMLFYVDRNCASCVLSWTGGCWCAGDCWELGGMTSSKASSNDIIKCEIGETFRHARLNFSSGLEPNQQSRLYGECGSQGDNIASIVAPAVYI